PKYESNDRFSCMMMTTCWILWMPLRIWIGTGVEADWAFFLLALRTARSTCCPPERKICRVWKLEPESSTGRATTFHAEPCRCSILTRSAACDGVTWPDSVSAAPVSAVGADALSVIRARTRWCRSVLCSVAAETLQLRLVCTAPAGRVIE